MDRLREMAAFAAVAEAGGFAKAARKLALSPPAVTRLVAGLEARLGARLLQRTTRSVRLTETGRHFLVEARRLLAEIDAAEKAAAGEAAAPQGHLTVTASLTFGRIALAPVIRAFLDAYPTVSAGVLLVDRVVNLVEEGIDVAVRIGALADSSLVARRIGAVRTTYVASPAYLKRHGTPRLPAALASHAVIAFSGQQRDREWRFVEGGRPLRVALAPRLAINDAQAAIEAAERGEGIVNAFSYMVARAIRAGRLVPVLRGHAPPAVPVQIVYPQSRIVAGKLRAFVDFAAPRLAKALRALEPPGGLGDLAAEAVDAAPDTAG